MLYFSLLKEKINKSHLFKALTKQRLTNFRGIKDSLRNSLIVFSH